MRVTIIKDDHAVSVNGESHMVDCGDLPADFHALQWDGKSGEIEYRMIGCEHCGARSKKPNTVISDLAPYQIYVDRWTAAKAAAEAEAERVKAAHAARPEN